MSGLAPLRRALRSSRLPFEMRARLEWWADMKFRPPRTFNQLVRRRMAIDRRPLLQTFNDKVAVREYVAQRVGRDVLPIHYAVVDDPRWIDRRALPREFVVKPSHGSGATLIVTEGPAVRSQQPDPALGWRKDLVHADALDWDALVRTCTAWLRTSFGSKYLAWGYLHVPPRIIVEEFLGPPVPDDVKFYMFDGVPRYINIVTNQYGDRRVDWLTPAWEWLDLATRYPNSDRAIPRPSGLDTMLEIAGRLSAGVDYVRVDLYEVAGRVMFGELTTYPGAGYIPFEPPSFDAEVGRWWAPRK